MITAVINATFAVAKRKREFYRILTLDLCDLFTPQYTYTVYDFHIFKTS